jgi:hypothetical protein
MIFLRSTAGSAPIAANTPIQPCENEPILGHNSGFEWEPYEGYPSPKIGVPNWNCWLELVIFRSWGVARFVLSIGLRVDVLRPNPGAAQFEKSGLIEIEHNL